MKDNRLITKGITHTRAGHLLMVLDSICKPRIQQLQYGEKYKEFFYKFQHKGFSYMYSISYANGNWAMTRWKYKMHDANLEYISN